MSTTEGGERTTGTDDAPTRLRTLVEITRSFAEATTDYLVLLQGIVKQVGTFLGGYCFLGLVTDDETTWELIAEHSDDEAFLGEIREMMAERRMHIDTRAPSPTVARTGKPFVLEDISSTDWADDVSPRFREIAQRHRMRGFICVPMRSKGTVVGTLAAGRLGEGAKPFASEDLDLLQVLADHAAQSITVASLLDTVSRELDEHKRTRALLERSQSKLRHAAKMEAIGRLAGGVAHDFNNILSVVLSYSEMIMETPGLDELVIADLGEIHKAGTRAAELTRQLLAFSRQQVRAPRLVDLNDILTNMAPMLRRLAGEDVVLEVVPALDLHRCLIDPGQVEQVVMNLAVNALEAMPKGGKITITTSNAVFDEAYVAAHPESVLGPHAVLSVSDTGSGLDSASISQVFDPFTTRADNVSSGLGLSAVYGIVTQSGGSVTVMATATAGTTFHVYLPRAEHTTDTPKDHAKSGHAPPTETVLLVEDEAQVRKLVQGILSKAGYRVIEARNGSEAMAICTEHPNIQLLVTDVVMPVMSGPELAGKLARSRPEIKVLFMSGYTGKALGNHGILDPGAHFVPKPVTPDSLLGKVREALSS
jgi:signal transduction histidine kinase